MSVHLEMQIEELEEELAAIKAINQKLQLEKNAIKEQFSLYAVSQRSEQLKSFADWLQGEVWDDKYDDFSEYVDDYQKTL
jgi:hypothetical protein